MNQHVFEQQLAVERAVGMAKGTRNNISKYL